MSQVQQLLGIGANSINWYQAALRTVIVYIVTIAMVRIGQKRFLGKSTAFDIIVGFILGSLISTAINSQVPFFPTLLAGFVLVGLHWLFAVITFKSDTLDTFLKGKSSQLIENGEIRWDALKKSDITSEDLLQEIRTVGQTEDLRSIKKAFFERSGDISVIKFDRQPRILEVKVEEGVQIIRILLEP